MNADISQMTQDGFKKIRNQEYRVHPRLICDICVE